jgi:hypothetical protein
MPKNRICSVEGCGGKHKGLGLCQKHYNKQNYAKYYAKNYETVIAPTHKAYREKNGEALREKIRTKSRTLRGRFYKIRQHGRQSDISFEDFGKLNSQPCHYCGGPLPINGVGLDRVDSAQDYFLCNVVPCCTICNQAKSDQTKEEFLAWIDRVYKRQHEPEPVTYAIGHS